MTTCCHQTPTAPAPHGAGRARTEDPGQVLLAEAVLALTALDVALARLTREQSTPAGSDLWRHADGCRYVICLGISCLDCELLEPAGYATRHEHALVPDAGLPAIPAAVVALYDALDALLDLGAWHCPDWNCSICADADGLVFSVRGCLDRLGVTTFRHAATAARAVQSALRKRARVAGGGEFYPHTAAEHAGHQDLARAA